MKEAMKNFESAVNGLTELCKAEFGKCLFDEDMDEAEISAMQKVLVLIDASKNLIKAQTNMMIEMDRKLDILLEKGKES